MGKKRLITVREEKRDSVPGRVFDISFSRHLLGVVIFSAFDLRAFNREGYLTRLMENFKAQDKSCYILFSSFGGVRGASGASIDKVLALTDSYLALEPIIPEKWPEKMLISSSNPIYFFILGLGLQRLGEIIDYIDSIDTRCVLIFEDAQKKDLLYAQIKQLHKKKEINDASLLSLGVEMASLHIGKYGAEESFKLYSRRFSLPRLKDIVLASVDQEKFEVKIK